MTTAEETWAKAGRAIFAGESTAGGEIAMRELGDVIARLRALCAAPREWDEREADSAEARSARAYNSALAHVGTILDATTA